MQVNIVFLDSTKLKIVWTKITTVFKRRLKNVVIFVQTILSKYWLYKKPAHKLRTRLGFKEYDGILTNDQSVLTQIISWFEGENMQTQDNGIGLI